MIIDSLQQHPRMGGDPMYAICDARMLLDEFNALPRLGQPPGQARENMLVNWDGQDLILIDVRTQGTPIVNAGTSLVRTALNVHEVRVMTD